MLDTFRLPFVQRGLLEIVLLAVASGVLGTWIVLRGLAFFSHAIGGAAFPGLVLADGLGFSAHLGAAGAAGCAALAMAALSRHEDGGEDRSTALMLLAALVIGVLLASDVFHSGANVDTLLFGSLLLIDGTDVAWACAAAAATVVATWTLGARWTAEGFDRGAARAAGLRSRGPDLMLLALIGFVAIAALSALGALLATAMLVVPAATARLVCSRLVVWRIASVALAAAEGTVGIWLAIELNAPPGAAIAVLAGCAFALVALARARPRIFVTAAAGLAAVLLAGCGGASDDRGGDGSGSRLAVVATSTQLGDFARAVGGDRVTVTQILHANTDPHDYEPRPADVQATAGARLVLESGDNLDAWMRKVVEQAGGDPSIAVVGEAVPVKLPGEPTGPEASKFDPHWWHDPRNAEAAVAAIRNAMSKADSAHADGYRRNASAYIAKLRTLDHGIRSCMASVPASRRKLVTDHDAFGYFARRYGVTVIGAVIPSQTTQAQPSAADVSQLSKLIRREGVKAVFPESSVNPKLARAIARQTGASAGYTLYGDTLGAEDSDGATYLTMERHNADAMVRGFTDGKRNCEIEGL